ncbi:MAG TPA: redox-regulated ATPase YchF [Armatimonadota bacterium]|nr:redox-regulated ATPase YchF [Armatimonadota bacterium]
MLGVGIVGLPNVGKSTVFNALCAGGAKVSNYAFCTIEPNHAVVSVPDPRLETVARIFGQENMVPAAIEFADIAGLVRGANQGEGLGNQFLAAIREVDAVLHVVRCFEDTQVAHVEGPIDPVRDVAVVETELILADLGAVERRREKIAPALKGRSKEAIREAEALDALAAHLAAGRPARTLPERETIVESAQVFLLTDKPEVYLANTGEDEGESAAHLQRLSACVGGPVVALSGRLEADLAEMEEGEREAFVAELQLSASGLERVIQACYETLDLVTFFTGVGAEARAWALPRGTTAVQAAGRIHTDMEKGFIRAEVIPIEELAEVGSWQEAHRAGRARTEGRDYVVQEGDVLLIRFNP